MVFQQWTSGQRGDSVPIERSLGGGASTQKFGRINVCTADFDPTATHFGMLNDLIVNICHN